MLGLADMDSIEVEYQEILDYLYSFVDYSLTRNLRYTPEKFDLNRMRKLMENLGNPHHQYPVVHVAGTKGKGSTAAMIASVLQSAGYKVGFYTSPHLIDFAERIQINRVPISHADLVFTVNKLKPSVNRIKRLTTFELTTAAAFMYFAHEKVDIAVIEVGLGGRLDATNVVDPLLAVITSLSLDHTNVLGDTLEKIAFEKAGIIKPNKPVVVSPQKEAALTVLKNIALERSAELIQAGIDSSCQLLVHDLEGQTIRMCDKSRSELDCLDIRIPLLGYHQVENACTAFTTVTRLEKLGWNIPRAAIQEGFEKVNWPGRFEIIDRDPFVVVDSAHNRDSAEKLKTTLDEYFPGSKVVLIFGASEDKDISGMFAELLPRMEHLILTQSVHPRAIDTEALIDLAAPYGTPAEMVVPIEKAIDRAFEVSRGECLILVTGSLFIVAGVRQAYKRKQSLSIGSSGISNEIAH
jgi:dihydrofolate synthase/folylpolyglutamate synthase